MINNFEKSNELRKKASRLIPGGAHTYSKGDDQFPFLSPHSIVKGKGARVWDVDGNEFVDWGMGLSSVLLGHAYEPVIEVIKKELENGVNFIRPSFIEAELAEMIIDQIPSAEMVKFAKNGSNATTSAIKLARAFTGKDIVLRCIDQPFLSIDDWFIGDTKMNSGVTNSTKKNTKHFKYDDIKNLEDTILKYKELGIACVIMEPAAMEEPSDNYLINVKKICEKEGIVLIFDEVVTGFRFHPKGAQYRYKVIPDLSTFGKAMANGYSISALVGKKEIMNLGGLEHDKERVFLLSTTYGGETHHLRAAQKTIEILNQNNYKVTNHIWYVGKTIKEAYNQLVKKYDLENYTGIQGIDCRPYFYFKDDYLRTLFLQEMTKYGILLQSILPSFSHGKKEIDQTIEGFDKSLEFLKYCILNNNVKNSLIGNPIKPVFRKYN